MFKTFYSSSDGRMNCFNSDIGCSESKVIFKWRKTNKNNKNKKKAFTRSKRSHLVNFIQSQSELSRDKQTQALSLLEYFCSYVQEHHPKGAQTTWSVVLVIQTRYFLLFDNRRAVYKRSTKCCGDKSITSFTDSLNFIQLLRVVITPSSDNVWIRPAVNAVQWSHYSFVLIHVKSLTRFSSGKPRNIVWKCLHDTGWLYLFFDRNSCLSFKLSTACSTLNRL